MRVLVAGATGKTGRILMQELKERGHEPIAMVRESSDTSVLPDGAETRLGDLADLDPAVARNVEAVVFAAGSGGDTGPDMTDKIDRDGAKALIDAAGRAGIERFVMLSSVGADAPSEGPEALRNYLEAKHDADGHLMQSGLDYAIVRPVALTDEDGAGRIELAPAREGSEIARADVASVLAEAVTAPEARGKTFEIAKGERPVEQALKSL